MEEIVKKDPLKEREKVVYGKWDYGTAAVVLAAAWLYMRGGWYFPGTWLPLFTAVFLTAGCLFLRQAGRKMNGEEKLYLLFIVLAACWFFIKYLPGQQADFEDQDIMPYVALFLHGSGVYWVLAISKSRVNSCLDECSLWDLGRGFFWIPFANFGRFLGVAVSVLKELKQKVTGSGKSGPVPALGSGDNGEGAIKAARFTFTTLRSQIFLGVIISIPVLFLVLPLLAAADDSFKRFIGGMGVWCSNLLSAFGDLFTIEEIIMNLLVFLSASYLYGLFFGSFHGKAPAMPRKPELPSAVLLTFGTIICGVYLLFFLVKFGDMAGVVFGQERKIIYSAYARQGFFELCFIAGINFGLFYFIKVLSSMKKAGIRQALTALGIETLGFIVLALSKMLLYISVYGFTFNRVFTCWFMFVLLFTFVFLIKAVWKKSNAIRLSVWFASVTFLLLAYSNPEWWIERLNSLR